jgi:hypothetical protein
MKTIQNLQAFNSLIGYCTGFGGKYNPGRQNLHIENLQAQLVAVRQVLEKVKETKVHFINEVNERKQVFAQLPALSSSVLRAMVASGTSPERQASARMLLTSILGYPHKAKAPVPAAGATAEGEIAKRSSLQMSYWSKVDSFSQLVKMVASEPLYQPNEQELSLDGLTKKLAELEAMNQRVSDARVYWSNARTERDNLMYGNADSMYEVARQVKNYLRSIFGFNSNEYQQVKRISITKL